MRVSSLLITIAIAFAVAASVVIDAVAEEYPSRPIAIVVPFPAGAATDSVARILADRMQASLGQPLRVENVSGAGGTIGVERVVHAAPDGYTALVGNWSSNVGAPAVYPVTFDVFRDLQPVSRLSEVPMMLIGRNGLPASNFAELIGWLRAHPGSATAATIGIGSGAQICAAGLQKDSGARLQLVPYRGGTPAIQDVLAGQIDIMCGEASGMLPHVRARSVKPFAVMKATRWPPLPEVPTIAEAGLPNLDLAIWNGLWLPANTPTSVVAKLNGAVRAALADPVVRQRLEKIGQELPTLEQQTPAGLAAYHKAETERWWPAIKSAQQRPE